MGCCARTVQDIVARAATETLSREMDGMAVLPCISCPRNTLEKPSDASGSLFLLLPLQRVQQKAPTPSKAGQPIPGLGSSSQPAVAQPAGAQTAAPGTPAEPQPPAAKPVPAQLPAVVAKVNGESIERWELESAIHGVEGRAGTAMPPERRDELVRGLVDQLIAYHILAQQAHARKMDASDADVDARVAQIKGGLPSAEAFQQALAAQGMSLDQLKQTAHKTSGSRR